MQKKHTILIVEDDHLLRKVLEDLFHTEFNVIEAEDGQKAVERAEAYKPDIIVLDLIIPKINGFKVLETIRKNPDEAVSGIPVVVLSNLYSHEDILEAERMGSTSYLVKGHCDLADIEKRVKETLGMIL